MGRDNTALPEAVNTALEDWNANQLGNIGSVSVSDLLMDYNGNKSGLVRDLAGISQKGKLPAKGTPERTAYDTQMRNVNRWLKSESGREGQKRKPNAAAQERFRELSAKKRPPQTANFIIVGTIAYSSDVRERVIGADSQQINLTGDELSAFFDSIAQGHIQDAYQDLFSAYGVPGMVMQDDTTPEIDITFN
jgi:hypothetical protein